MALSPMSYARSVVADTVEILYNSEYVGKAITLDASAFTSGLCKAGTPIGSDGTVANTANVVGILLHDTYVDRPIATIVIGGYIKKSVAEAHSSVTYESAAMAALKNIVFC